MRELPAPRRAPARVRAAARGGHRHLRYRREPVRRRHPAHHGLRVPNHPRPRGGRPHRRHHPRGNRALELRSRGARRGRAVGHVRSLRVLPRAPDHAVHRALHLRLRVDGARCPGCGVRTRSTWCCTPTRASSPSPSRCRSRTRACSMHSVAASNGAPSSPRRRPVTMSSSSAPVCAPWHRSWPPRRPALATSSSSAALATR